MHFDEQPRQHQHQTKAELIAGCYSLSDLFAGRGGCLTNSQRQVLHTLSEELAGTAGRLWRRPATESETLIRTEGRTLGSSSEVLDIRTYPDAQTLLVLGHTAPVHLIRAGAPSALDGLYMHEKFAYQAASFGPCAPRLKSVLVEGLPNDNPALKTALGGYLGDKILQSLPEKGLSAAKQYFLEDSKGPFTYLTFPGSTVSAQFSVSPSNPENLSCEIFVEHRSTAAFQIDLTEMNARTLDFGTAGVLRSRPLVESDLHVLQHYFHIFSHWIEGTATGA
jgi:hypothetical protein